MPNINIKPALPKHIAIVMDGNGRWSQKRSQPRVMGHRAGAKTVRIVVEYCVAKKIPALTLFAFSTENWSRPKEEVSWLMDLFFKTINREINELHDNNVRLKIIGDASRFSLKLQKVISEAESITANNSGLALNVAANYGGRWDILQAIKKLAADLESGKASIDNIDEASFGKYLKLNSLPEPDLFIRTGGESRISNFLIWQIAYAELYFTDVCWPDFSTKDMDTALEHFASRERRFGKI